MGMAQPALSLTAEELWAEWQSQSAAMGQIVSAEQVTPGNGTLTLTGYSSVFSDPDVSTQARLDQVVMTETGDGRVVITMSDMFSVRTSFIPEPNAPLIDATFNVLIPGLSITAAGPVEARVYDYVAPRITIEDGPIIGGPASFDLMIGIEDFSARYEFDGSAVTDMSYDSQSSIGAITGALDVVAPDGVPGRLKVAFAMGATTGTGSGSFGNMIAMAANPAAYPAGLAFDGGFSYESARLEMTFEHPSDAFTLLASNQGGSLSSRFSESDMAFRMAATESQTYFLGPDLPVPIDISLASGEFGFVVPLGKSDAPQPFSARLAYRDVVLNPELWGLIDPSQAIPRDPVTAIADVSGTVRVLMDLFSANPTAMGAMPGELVDMTLNELRVTAAGAELTGTGSASFSPGPFPMPVGRVGLQLSGANALLDRLQNSGLIPIEQVAMARGFMAALTRPASAPDTVETEIEFRQGGGITANGVPLQ